jgi:hypothetical protein
MKEKIKDEVLEIISIYALIPKEKLSLDMEILDDLGIAGEDAYNMIEEICIKFEINCKEFNPNDVCLSEGGGIATLIVDLYHFFTKNMDTPTFTIRMILEAVKTKKLKSVKPEGYFYAKEVITK